MALPEKGPDTFSICGVLRPDANRLGVTPLHAVQTA